MIISFVKASVRLLLLLTFFKCLVYAITPESRGESECLFMPTYASIFCYGGQIVTRSSTLGETASQAILGNVFISLNLTQDMNVKDMESTWVQHPDVGPNSYFGFTAVPDQDIIFMDGGIGAADSGTTLARFKTTTYNIVTKTWADNLPARDGAMVRSHMATLGQDNNTVYVWGGYRDQSTGLPAGSGYQIPMEMYMYDVKNSRWSSGSPASSLDQIRMSHEAVRIGSNIYYIGGTYAETVSSYKEAPMNSIIIYDTDKSQWSTQTTNGPVPTTRIRHSATLIPSTGQIVLFGGQSPFNNTIFREDYFFILDTKNSMTWSTRGIGEQGPSFNGTGIYGHSAVLVENNLFILFGRLNDVNLGIIANNVLVMDVNNWSWISSISAVAPVDRSINGPSPDSTPISNSSSDNKGAIAGAVVGALAGVSIIAGAIFFFIRRKRNQPSNNEQSEYVSHNNNIPSSSSEEPPPLHYYNTDTDNNNNAYQPMLAASEVPHSVDESVSSGRGYIRSPISTDTTSSWHDRSAYYGSEKPDASVSPGSFSEYSEPIRLTLKPVKPDGA